MGQTILRLGNRAVSGGSIYRSRFSSLDAEQKMPKANEEAGDFCEEFCKINLHTLHFLNTLNLVSKLLKQSGKSRSAVGAIRCHFAKASESLKLGNCTRPPMLNISSLP